MEEKQQQNLNKGSLIMDNNINDESCSSSKIGSSPLFDTGQSEDPSICPYCNKKFRKVFKFINV